MSQTPHSNTECSSFLVSSNKAFTQSNHSSRKTPSEIQPSHHAIIIDNGSQTIKAGWSGEDEPRYIIPTVVGRIPRQQTVAIGNDALNYVPPTATPAKSVVDQLLTPMGFQNHLQNQYTAMQLSSPIERSIINNMDDMEKIWNHVLSDKLRVKTEECGVVMNENCYVYEELGSLQAVEKYREKITEILFEKFNIPFLYFGVPQTMSLYSLGKTSGFGIDIGHATTTGVPVIEGIALLNGRSDLDRTFFGLPIGGLDLSEYLTKMLLDSNIRINTTAEKECIDQAKRKFTYVATDFAKEMKKIETDQLEKKTYQLPDGKPLVLGKERFISPEILFQPKLLSLAASQSNRSGQQRGRSSSFKFLMMKKVPTMGIHELTHQAIAHCPENAQEELFSNIILSGGSSLIQGLQERIVRDVKREIALKKQSQVSQTKVKVTCPKHRELSSWIGASMLSSYHEFFDEDDSFSHSFAMGRNVYNEEGARSIHSYYNH